MHPEPGNIQDTMAPRFFATLFEARGQFGNRVVGHIDVPWTPDALTEALPLTVTPTKGGSRLFALAKYREGVGRGNAGIEHLTGAMLDCDCADPGEFDRITEQVRAKGLAFLAYTTYSHMSPSKTHSATGRVGSMEGFRLFLPWSRPVDHEEYRVLVPCLFGYEIPDNPPHYEQEVAGVWVKTKAASVRARARGWDSVSSRPSQAYYMPEAPPERASLALFDSAAGDPLPVDQILARERPLGRRSFYVPRDFEQPTQQAETAVQDFLEALMDAGHHVQPPNGQGYRRSACPACAPGGVQRSPSLTFRANGDMLEVRCHAACYRRDILAALGLTDEGRFREPGYLESRLDEQLARQVSPRAPVPVNEAVGALERDLREAVLARRPTVIKYPCGVGKSFCAAKIVTERVRAGQAICVSSQEHRVLMETMAYLPEDVRQVAVHIHSPLIPVGGAPVCQRADEVRELVWDYGVSLARSICPTCPHRDTCGAKAAQVERIKRKTDALAVFVSHAGIHQVFGEEPSGMELIVDEMPGVYEEVAVTKALLEKLADRAPLPAVYDVPRKAVYAIARAWLDGTEPGYVVVDQDQPPVPAYSVAAEWGRLALKDKTLPPVDFRALVKAGDALLRLAAHRADGGTVFGLEQRGATGVSAMLPDACHRALVRQRGVLLSATPLLAALPGFDVREQAVTDGAPVRRVMRLRNNRGSTALTKTYPDRYGGFERREPAEGEGPGIPWAVVEQALDYACKEAEMYDPARVLFVSFKALIDQLRQRPDLLRGRAIELAHYGALRGKNQWQQGAAAECSVVYCLGAPRFAVYSTLRSLGLSDEALDEAWVAYAAGELEQVGGRLRIPRRTKPASFIVESDVAPQDWCKETINEVDLG